MARLALSDTLALPKGAKIPMLGFGVWQSPRGKCVQSCMNAFNAGYRHIDTAQGYTNEAEVGEAVQKCGLPRDQVFITTKFFPDEESADEAYQGASESVKKCDPREGGYVDLFLVHQAKAGPSGRKMMWQVLERLVEEGKAKNIGVSNFGPNHIEEMKAYAKIWPPSVNQIEVSCLAPTAMSTAQVTVVIPFHVWANSTGTQLHPWTQQKAVVQYCEQNGIVVEAYCPIVRNQKADDPTLVPIAKDLGVTPNQVLIRYCLQKGWIPLPKSDDPGRMKLNADLYDFEISPDQMAKLDALDQGAEAAVCPENIPDSIP